VGAKEIGFERLSARASHGLDLLNDEAFPARANPGLGEKIVIRPASDSLTSRINDGDTDPSRTKRPFFFRSASIAPRNHVLNIGNRLPIFKTTIGDPPSGPGVGG
jgi:hypothetical protein